jgi:hypothetical protein
MKLQVGDIVRFKKGMGNVSHWYEESAVLIPDQLYRIVEVEIEAEDAYGPDIYYVKFDYYLHQVFATCFELVARTYGEVNILFI